MYILPEIPKKMLLRMIYEKAKPFLLCILIITVFALGLYLGGTSVLNKTKSLRQEMEKTRQMIQKHPNSVILIRGDVADFVGFEPRNRWDYEMKRRQYGDVK